MHGPLEGYRVLDFGRGQAASMAGLLLAQTGASVMKLDDDAGVPALDPIRDALWNRQKQRARIDSGTDAGRNLLRDHLGAVDILIHDCIPSAARRLGIDAESLGKAFPRLIHVAIGGWPAGHPQEETPVDDALALAEAGILDEQAAVARDGPVWLRLPIGSNHAAYLAAAGALARLYGRARSGRGGPVTTSLVQGALVPMMMHWQRAERPTRSVLLGMPKASAATLFQCGDGSWIHTMGAPQQCPTVGGPLEAMDPEERAQLNAKYIDAVVKYPGLWDEWGAVEAIFKTRTRDEWLPELWAADVPAQPVLRMGELYGDAQAAANGYVVEGEDPRFGRIRHPGPPFQIDEKTEGAARPPPASADPRYPLSGLKVLDLGNFLAGPLAAMMLGDLGAEVIKLEAIAGDPMRFVDWAFNGCQRNKRTIAVQLKDDKGREVMQRLVGWADVLHHNQRLPAADKLGFGWEAACALNPALVYCHVSSYGPKGPRKDWPGYDQLFQAAAGWEYEGAGEGNPPMWHRFGMLDHLGALASVVATLAALVRRDHTGKGEFVAASLLGVSLASLETFVLPDGSLAPYDRLDSQQMGLGPARRLYRCHDGWIVVSNSDPAASEALDGLGGEAQLSETLSRLPAADALALVRGAGLAAAEVRLANRDAFLDDPDNRRLKMAAEIEHGRYGRFEHVGTFWGFGDLDVRLDRGPSQLGEHSREILEEIGYGPGEREMLIRAGAVGDAAA